MVYLKVNLKIYHFYYIHTKIEKITKNFACQINAGENILDNKKLVNLSRRFEDVLKQKQNGQECWRDTIFAS